MIGHRRKGFMYNSVDKQKFNIEDYRPIGDVMIGERYNEKSIEINIVLVIELTNPFRDTNNTNHYPKQPSSGKHFHPYTNNIDVFKNLKTNSF